MTDKILALMALATLAGFLGIIVSFVPEPDLVIIVAVVILMTCFDFFRELFSRNGKE